MQEVVGLAELFCIFFYIGLFTIGGGVVAITLMQQMIVDRGLISQDFFYNMIAISESTPGPLGINMATYVGYTLHGVAGGVIVTIGETLPSVIIILLIARILAKFRSSSLVESVFITLRPAATSLILVATVNICLDMLFTSLPLASIKSLVDMAKSVKLPCLIFYLLLLLFQRLHKVHPLFLIVLGAVFGILFL